MAGMTAFGRGRREKHKAELKDDERIANTPKGGSLKGMGFKSGKGGGQAKKALKSLMKPPKKAAAVARGAVGASKGTAKPQKKAKM